MIKILISERRQNADGSFNTCVSFPNGAEYEVQVVNPANAEVEAVLAWYFEEHLRYPFLDHDRRQMAVEQIAAYGQELFAQTFAGNANYDYKRYRDRGFDQCRLEIMGSAAFHRLHWEALRDPNVDSPLAVHMPLTRRVDLQAPKYELRGQCETLNILIVTARPFAKNDVGYRTISRPLLRALRQARLPLTVDLVRPGTWAALRNHLKEMANRHENGWYHVIHLDLHGAFGETNSPGKQEIDDQAAFCGDHKISLEGRQGFLFFETTQEGRADPVSATAVASLLAEHRVPMVILNACQSAMQTTSEAALAQRLVEAGVPVAVGMAYSVTVSAAVTAMPILYSNLAAGVDPINAFQSARRLLFEQRSRQAYFNEQIELEDWMLPVAFSQHDFQLNVRSMTDKEYTRFLEREADVDDEPITDYGFVGRDTDIQAIERQLLIPGQPNQLLVQGMAGSGKSSLLRHLGWWWRRTGLVSDVFRFSYEDRAWTAPQMIREVGKVLLNSDEWLHFDALPESARMEYVAGLLRANRYLLIIDNAELITASLTPHALDDAERNQLRDFLSKFDNNRTLILIGSREAESWLVNDASYVNNYLLRGLDPEAASILVQRILRRHNASRHLEVPGQRVSLEKLIELLKGYTLALTAVLPALENHTPQKVLHELRIGGDSPDPVGVISRAVEYSYEKLDSSTRNSLLLLTPFVGVVPTGLMLDRYQELLLSQDSVQALRPIDLNAAVRSLVDIGLAEDHSDLPNIILYMHPVLPYFLRRKIREVPAVLDAVGSAHFSLYSTLSGAFELMLNDSDPANRLIAETLVRAEYGNLNSALQYALDNGKLALEIINALGMYLRNLGQQTPRYEITQNAIVGALNSHSEVDKANLAELRQRAGRVMLAQREFGEAELHYRAALEIYLHLANEEGVAQVYGDLGNVAWSRQQLDVAADYCRRALDIFVTLGNHEYAALILQRLGEVACAEGRLEDAEKEFEKAQMIYLRLDNQDGLGNIYEQRARTAVMREKFDDAEAYYRAALNVRLRFSDEDGAAAMNYGLGRVAYMRGQLEVADAHFRKALGSYLDLNNEQSASRVYQILGAVTSRQRRFDEAQRYAEKVLEISTRQDDQRGMTVAHGRLALIAQEQNNFDLAVLHNQKALEIARKTKDVESVAEAFAALGRMEEARDCLTEAEAYYRKAIELFELLDNRGGRLVATISGALSELLVRTGRHLDALEVMIDTAVNWRSFSGQFDARDLQPLNFARKSVSTQSFRAILEHFVPLNIADELERAIDEMGS